MNDESNFITEVPKRTHEYFVSHNVAEVEASEYIDNVDDLLFKHYSADHIYNHFIDENYNKGKTQSHTHDRSKNNQDQVYKSHIVGCYNCLNWYPSKEIITFVSYMDEIWSDMERSKALCPKCGIDTCIPFERYYYKNKADFKQCIILDDFRLIIYDMHNLWISPDKKHDFYR